jgi:hypothetical protein
VLPMTVKLTDVTVDAVTGTVTSAWSCRGAEFASTAPRSHEDVPSALPQPKVKPGAPPLAGVACNWIVASGTSPPVVQALTVHWAACPRSVLACARATSTQRLACVVCDTVLAPICEFVLVAVPVGVGVGFALRVRLGAGVTFAVTFAVGLGVAFGVVFGATLGEDLTMARVFVADGLGVFAGVFVGVAAGLDFSVRVGAAVALADAEPELETLAVTLGCVSGDGLVVAGVADGVPDEVAGDALAVVGVALGVVGVELGVVGVELGVVGVELGVVGVELGVCEVGVGDEGLGEGDWLTGAAGICNGSQDSPLAVEAVLATAVLAATVRVAPEAASRTLPAISVTVAGRACAKRMKRPISAARCGIPPTGHQVPGSAPPGPHTRLSVRITAMAVFRGRFFEEVPGVDGWDEVGRR